MATAYQSSSNTFVPSPEATNNLVIGFSRNPKDFSINRYAQQVEVSKMIGLWWNLTVAEAGRIRNTNLSDHIWPDGLPAPKANWGTESFESKKYETQRYLYGFTMGQLAEEQADWNILSAHAAIKAQQAMTGRTVKALDAFATAGNWGTHTATATALGGGKVDTGTPTDPRVKIMFNAAAQVILADTLGVVKPRDLVVVISPAVAVAISESQEVHAYLKENPVALQVLKGEDNVNAAWGLPAALYGYPIVIEDCIRNSATKDGSTNAQALTDSIMMVSRPGGMTGIDGSPSFSTITLFIYKKDNMTVESKTDPDNRLVEGRVIDNFAAVVTAPASGYLITDAL